MIRKRPNTDAIRPLLRRIGLDDKEIEVYLALLALKAARVSDVAVAAKQSRSHTYGLLRQLQERGLVSSVERGKVLHFVAETPGRLVTHLRDRASDLLSLEPLVQSIVPTLSSLSRPLPGQPRVTLLHGREGMLQIYGEALAQEYCAFMNPDALFDVFPENLPQLVLRKGMQLKGRELMVDVPAARRALKEYPSRPNDGYEVRLLPKGMQCPAEAIVYDDVLAYFAYDDELTSVRIENKQIADTFRQTFDALWGMGRSAK